MDLNYLVQDPLMPGVNLSGGTPLVPHVMQPDEERFLERYGWRKIDDRMVFVRQVGDGLVQRISYHLKAEGCKWWLTEKEGRREVACQGCTDLLNAVLEAEEWALGNYPDRYSRRGY